MKDCHDLYLKCDVLLLAFENYLSAPGLSWNALLKMTKIKLELTPDPTNMYIF